jgi:hypothetical protein
LPWQKNLTSHLFDTLNLIVTQFFVNKVVEKNKLSFLESHHYTSTIYYSKNQLETFCCIIWNFLYRKSKQRCKANEIQSAPSFWLNYISAMAERMHNMWTLCTHEVFWVGTCAYLLHICHISAAYLPHICRISAALCAILYTHALCSNMWLMLS